MDWETVSNLEAWMSWPPVRSCYGPVRGSLVWSECFDLVRYEVNRGPRSGHSEFEKANCMQYKTGKSDISFVVEFGFFIHL